jgi:hypothetical protein
VQRSPANGQPSPSSVLSLWVDTSPGRLRHLPGPWLVMPGYSLQPWSIRTMPSSLGSFQQVSTAAFAKHIKVNVAGLLMAHCVIMCNINLKINRLTFRSAFNYS